MKLFSYLIQLSMKLQMLIKSKMWKTKDILACKLSDVLSILANGCWHFNIYKQDKLHAQLLSMRKSL